MKRKILTLILAICMALSLVACAAPTGTETTSTCAVPVGTETTETEMETETVFALMSESLKVVEGADWCEGAEVTRNRDGKLIVVHNVGIVTDAKNGDGITDYGGYIGYHDLAATETIHNGDVVDTYLLVNPATDYWDDYITRWDFVREGN